MSKIIVTESVKSLYKQSIIIDLQLGFEPEIEAVYKWHILSKFLESGVSMVSLAIATDVTSVEKTIQFAADIREKIKSESSKYKLIETIEDISKAKIENKLAINFILQGPNPLGKNLNMLEVYYQLGVRSMILAYNIRNPFADGCIEPEDAGLSRLGKELVKKMNDIGMLIDCSHTGYRSSLEAIALSQYPVIFSHSNVYALHAHPRNLKDNQIKAIAQSEGIIGINGNSGLLGSEATPQKMVEHMDYIAQLVGAQVISLGTDWVYFPELFEDYMAKQAIFYSVDYRKGIESQPLTAIEPAHLLEIAQLLLDRGYKSEDVQGILGQNALRVMQKVWK